MYASAKDVILELKSNSENQTLTTSQSATDPYYIGCGQNMYSYSSSNNAGKIYSNVTWDYNYTYWVVGEQDWEIEEMN